MSDVAVLGTGIMGAPMALNLARAGFGVRVWNRTPERAEPLAGELEVVKEQFDAAVAGGHGDEDLAAALYAYKGDR